MFDLGNASIDKIIRFVRKWMIWLLVLIVLFVLFLAYLIIQFVAQYTLLVFIGLAVFAYIKRHQLRAFFTKIKLAVQDYQRKNNSNQ